MHIIRIRRFFIFITCLAGLCVCITPAIAQSGSSDFPSADERLSRFTDSVIQYHAEIESIDYFSQFAWGDEIFEQYLLMILRLEADNFEPGEGIVLSSIRSGSITTIERSLLTVEENGRRWWRIMMQGPGVDIEVEVLAAANTSLPLEIRYRDPMTGSVFARKPMLASGYEQIEEVMAKSMLDSVVDQIVSIDLERIRRWSLVAPQFVDTTTVEVGAGSFEGQHYTDAIEGGIADYWFDPVVPGSLILMTIADSDGNEVIRAELSELTYGNVSGFRDSEIIAEETFGEIEEEPLETYESEGTVDVPIPLEAGEIYTGRVGGGSKSYYRAYVPKRCDLRIVVSGRSVELDLEYFGTDSSFGNWAGSSMGTEVDIVGYFVRDDSHVFFTVSDASYEGDTGSSYSIEIESDYILDPLGVSMYNAFIDDARLIELGSSTAVVFGDHGLHYFKAALPEGGDLLIQATGLPPHAGLRWIDSTGFFSSVYSDQDTNLQRIMVSGLEKGSVAYFFIVGEPDSVHADSTFTLEVNAQ